ncbi:penicillin-binding transpeptidase domain-containing protein [Paenibacillus tyrfis]|uniref:penicillin-binding transpeptidase domain-containing protein n=1 Tax=Paenibacillus tyrfis TaxID=1501230 RepID=UPI0020A0EE8B|nr:penicillin-binding transpeptidase domain-containing protein [Paenibacillus tyrfis]MCP1311432.1 penicillin-binding transpeptidase domain-containing protein [Paenibacillus tyrfis]
MTYRTVARGVGWGVLFVALLLTLAACKPEMKPPEEVMDTFVAAWQKKDYAVMYPSLTSHVKESVTQEAFVSRHQNIYEGIGLTELHITAEPTEKDPKAKTDQIRYKLHVEMKTSAGPIEFNQTATLRKEERAWGVDWSSAFLFPQLKDTDKIRVQTLPAKRGEILDRQGHGLAINEDQWEVGLVPEKMAEPSDESVSKLAALLNLKPEDIRAKLGASWVKPELFVPIALIPKGDPRENEMLTVQGTAYRTKRVRSYPLGAAAAHLTGYIGRLNEKELEKRKDKGYRPDDWIGKTGLELTLEDRLRGRDGQRIYITDAEGRDKATLVKRDAVDGEDVKLTIDGGMQRAMYRELENDAGAGVAMQPLTGELLALVSTPSYDPNLWISGISAEQWKQWTENLDKPLFNRYASAYAPGSAFKPITAAIALEQGALDPKEEKTITGKQWKKDSSWGNYYVTRVSEAASAVNLTKALMYSDNIYFAQVALGLGAERFEKAAGKFGFGEKLPLPLAVDVSSLSNKGIKKEILLADSGYGQGEVVMSPLHVADAYTVFMNGGNMIKPVLEYDGRTTGEVWKSGLIRPEVSRMLTEQMKEVIQNPAGTGRAARIDGLTLAGKTGTAELKQKKGESGQENGWFVAYDTDKPKLLVALMVEKVEARGGSRHLAEKIKVLFQGFAK